MALEIILSIFACICFGSAVAIQKYSLGSMKKFNIAGMVKNKAWISSILVSVLGGVAYLAALSSMPLSTVQPIVSGSVSVPIIAGAVVFKEKMEARKWLIVGIIIAGIILVSAF